MPTTRRYSKPEKAKAVGIALMSGAEVASQVTGIPERTINWWKSLPEWEELRRQTPDIVAEQMWAAVQLGVEEVARGLRGDAPLRDKATALGILYDKHALLTGGATARSENRDITGTLSDSELRDAVREAERLVGGTRDAPTPADTPEGD